MDKIPINETPIKHNSIELFCGAGGLALGLQKAGFHHKALYELNKNACANIEANISAGLDEIKEWHVYQSDVSTGACQTFWKQTCKKFCHCTKMVHDIVQ